MTEPSPQAEVATYELAKDELAAVVSTLESGGLSLDDSLTLWDRGPRCQSASHRLCRVFLSIRGSTHAAEARGYAAAAVVAVCGAEAHL